MNLKKRRRKIFTGINLNGIDNDEDDLEEYLDNEYKQYDNQNDSDDDNSEDEDDDEEDQIYEEAEDEWKIPTSSNRDEKIINALKQIQIVKKVGKNFQVNNKCITRSLSAHT